MSRRSRKTRRRSPVRGKRQGRAASPGAPAARPAAPKNDEKRQFALRKIENRLGAGRLDRALSLLDGVWPRSGGVLEPARLEWLLDHWPSRAVQELCEAGDSATELGRPEVARAVAGSILALSEDDFSVLAGLEAPFVAEAGAVRRASSLVASGRGAEARAALKSIGLRSPFSEVKLFLRGLLAIYEGNDEEAGRALNALVSSAAYGPHAARLLASPNGPTLTGERDPSEPSSDILKAVWDRLSQGRVNGALREIAKRGPNLAEPLWRALSRDLPGALLASDRSVGNVLACMHRTFGVDPEDPEQNRLLAMLVERDESRLDTTGLWLDYAGDLERAEADLGDDGPLALAAVHAHVGEIYAEEARVAEERTTCTCPNCLGKARRLQQIAAKQYQRAVDADPACVEYWIELVACYGEAGENRKENRAVERFAKRFPERPESWLALARVAQRRGAPARALKDVRRAARLDPLSREIRDLESGLLLEKARQHAEKGQLAAARRAYDEACELSNRSPDPALEAAAESAAFEALQGKRDAVLTRRDDLLSKDPRPWLFAGHFLWSWERLRSEAPRKWRRKAPKADLRRLLDGAPPATVEELQAILELTSTFEDTFERLSTALSELLQRVIAAAGTRLTDPEELAWALGYASAPDLRLALAERGQEAFPDELTWATARYEAALQLKLPAEYFSSAVAELERKITLPWEAEGFDDFLDSLDEEEPELAEAARKMLGVMAAPHERTEALIDRVKSYLERSRRGRKRAARRRAAPTGQLDLSLG